MTSINPSAHRHMGITTIASKVSTNQGAKNLNRDGGNAGVFSRRCAVMGQTGRKKRPQRRRLVQGIRLRSRAAIAGSGATLRRDFAVWIRRGRAGSRQGARAAPSEACRDLPSLSTALRVRRAVSHAAITPGRKSAGIATPISFAIGRRSGRQRHGIKSRSRHL